MSSPRALSLCLFVVVLVLSPTVAWAQCAAGGGKKGGGNPGMAGPGGQGFGFPGGNFQRPPQQFMQPQQPGQQFPPVQLQQPGLPQAFAFPGANLQRPPQQLIQPQQPLLQLQQPGQPLQQIQQPGQPVIQLQQPGGQPQLNLIQQQMQQQLQVQQQLLQQQQAQLQVLQKQLAEQQVQMLQRQLQQPADEATPTDAAPSSGPAVKLAKLALSPDTATRKAALQALGRLGDRAQPAVTALIDALRSTDTQVQARAVRALAVLGPAAESASEPLVQLLANQTLRPEVVKTLGKIGTAAVPHLMAVLANEGSFTRLGASRALGEIGPAAFEAVAVLTGRAEADTSVSVREAAQEALKKIK
jgi:HEAT repeat protein